MQEVVGSTPIGPTIFVSTRSIVFSAQISYLVAKHRILYWCVD